MKVKEKCQFMLKGIWIVLFGVVAGCVPMTGSPSLTLLSRDLNRNSPQIEVVGDKIKESDSFTWTLIFLVYGSMAPSHEVALDRALEKYDADLLVESEFSTTTYGCPYIFMRAKCTVTGYPARFKGGVE
jgi:hypothetical protein